MINWAELKEIYSKEKRVAVRNRSLRLIEFFLPYCKNEADHNELKKVVDKFIEDCKLKSQDEIKVLYRSLTTRDRTEKCKELKFVNSNDKYRDAWGRPRTNLNFWADAKVVTKERAEKRAAKEQKAKKAKKK